MRDSVVNSRETHKLADDNTLGTVDYERTGLSSSAENLP